MVSLDRRGSDERSSTHPVIWAVQKNGDKGFGPSLRFAAFACSNFFFERGVTRLLTSTRL
jgi:hypothetical protein